MKKRFLLTAGDNYYPLAGDGDWVGFFETREEAEKCIEPGGCVDYRITLPSGHYTFAGWYEIIDVQNWDRKECDTIHVWYEPDEAAE